MCRANHVCDAGGSLTMLHPMVCCFVQVKVITEIRKNEAGERMKVEREVKVENRAQPVAVLCPQVCFATACPCTRFTLA